MYFWNSVIIARYIFKISYKHSNSSNNSLIKIKKKHNGSKIWPLWDSISCKNDIPLNSCVSVSLERGVWVVLHIPLDSCVSLSLKWGLWVILHITYALLCTLCIFQGSLSSCSRYPSLVSFYSMQMHDVGNDNLVDLWMYIATKLIEILWI